MMLTVSHVLSPTELAMSRLLAGFPGSTAHDSRCGFRSPYAQISVLAPGFDTNGLSLGIRYRPFSLTVLVAVCSFKSGMIRRILPERLSSRCGFDRMLVFASPAPPSPDEMYRTRHSGSPGLAAGLKIRSPS